MKKIPRVAVGYIKFFYLVLRAFGEGHQINSTFNSNNPLAYQRIFSCYTRVINHASPSDAPKYNQKSSSSPLKALHSSGHVCLV